jgi:ubiquinone/menaquinone biosynthesis C-methylase UbiE
VGTSPVREVKQPSEYMGRPIAQTMHYLGAEWLVRDNREQEERCSLMLANLGVKPGMRICDMGCGNGYYTLQLAKMVGAKGHLYAVDIQPEMLKMLNERAEAAGLDNLSPILGTLQNPRLPQGEIDLILMVDVYHEFSHPAEMLAAMKKALAPGGALVFVEFRAEDPKVPIKPEHKMTKAQLDKELTANGYVQSHEFAKLPWQHMVWYQPAKE